MGGEMSEENGGSLTAGQRLTRIETRLDTIFERLDLRITEHKKANDAHIAQLATDIMNNFGKRVTALEQSDTSEHAVKEALEEYQQKQQQDREKQLANIRWLIGLVSSLGIINIIVQVQGGG